MTSTVFHILLSLTDEERHGYGIMQEVEAMTRGQIRMGPGTLYGTIKRLLAESLIEESSERPDPEQDDERRRYYRITALGRRAVSAEALRLAHLVDVAQHKRIIGKPEVV